jgi:hypothetical protein
MPPPELCTKAEVAELVTVLYANVHDDAILAHRIPASLPQRARARSSISATE